MIDLNHDEVHLARGADSSLPSLILSRHTDYLRRARRGEDFHSRQDMLTQDRLHDHVNQESFFSTIVQRYMKFCASTGGGEPLEAAFASMAITDTSTAQKRPALPHRPSATERPNDLPNILMAMRKLREGILGSRRFDTFAQRAYVFIIHASILTRQWESYQPSLLHLLNSIHPRTPLSSSELQEFAGYQILDLACRQDDISEALIVRERFAHTDRRTMTIINSLIRDDWPRFWRLRRAVDGYQRALMQFAEERIRLHALKCIGRSYMSADKLYIERCADSSWVDLVKTGIGWQLQDNGNVIIRKPKSK